MNREILFRGKTANGEWVEGYFFKGKWYLNDTEIIAIAPFDLAIFPHCEISEYAEVLPETVGQYTGLTDKNGKQIFEGDIVILQLVDIKEMGCIKWSDSDCRFKFASPDGMSYGIDCTDVFVVIGNIHDNPELLI